LKSTETPLIKKKHRRTRSNAKNVDFNVADNSETDGFEFLIVSLDGRQWAFEASSAEERDEWMLSIEQRILSSLQLNDPNRSKGHGNAAVDATAAANIRTISGNSVCADCNARNPDWASINLGVVLCIECSGIHRNLGTHISRVRSLDLDNWPPELVLVMKAIGNDVANAVWEATCDSSAKPLPDTPRDEKEKWIRSKYESRQFLPALPYRDISLSQQLIDAVARQDVNKTVLVLSHCSMANKAHVSAPFSSSDWRTALHITAFLGNVVILQLLLWCGADARVIDHEGHDPLYYAQVSPVPSAVLCAQLLQTAQGCRDLLIS
jgi:Arf-GAP/GTPase/ANK repeat/PH domain-containing protein 1/3